MKRGVGEERERNKFPQLFCRNKEVLVRRKVWVIESGLRLEMCVCVERKT